MEKLYRKTIFRVGYGTKEYVVMKSGLKDKIRIIIRRCLMENKTKHLEFIQSTISSMNQNTFQIKDWMIKLVSALLAFYASVKNQYILL